eukprot:TRINITY_DN28527_c0_g1_i1.p1 TRINITY_DN28527_c0_g1~~TRINITY_DN28527_c0_g1_i1.p1  ORF type:complete len:205 (-),score=-17.20 TRINITY_DN28527_c0_g1_i1:42-626(-)
MTKMLQISLISHSCFLRDNPMSTICILMYEYVYEYNIHLHQNKHLKFAKWQQRSNPQLLNMLKWNEFSTLLLYKIVEEFRNISDLRYNTDIKLVWLSLTCYRTKLASSKFFRDNQQQWNFLSQINHKFKNFKLKLVSVASLQLLYVAYLFSRDQMDKTLTFCRYIRNQTNFQDQHKIAMIILRPVQVYMCARAN